MRKRLTLIDPGACAKVLAVLYGLIGIMGSVFFFIGGLLSQSPAVAIDISIVLPFAYAIGGLIGGYLGALLYNVVAEITGGFVLTLDDDFSDESPQSTVVYSKPQ
jgi:hypothetical protein